MKSYRSRIACIALMAAATLAMTACNSSSSPPAATYGGVPAGAVAPAVTQVGAAPAPVVVQQAAAPHDGTSNLLLGAVAGGLATHMLTNNRQAQHAPPTAYAAPPTTINKTVIHKTTIVQAPSPKASASSTSRPSTSSVRTPVSLTKFPSYSSGSTNYRPSPSYASTTTRVSYSPSASSTARR